MTPWAIASAHKLGTACPRLLTLTELTAVDALQVWSVWDRLCQLGPRPRVLEIGHGAWSAVLAVMTETLDGAFCSVGPEQADTHALRERLEQAGTGSAVQLGTAPLVETGFDAGAGLFPDLSVLEAGLVFELIWISAPKALADAARVDHVLPAVSGRLSTDGFDVLLEGAAPEPQAQALRLWQQLAGSALTMRRDAWHGAGLLVSGRPQTSGSHAAPAAQIEPLGITIRKTIQRPELTLPALEAREVARHYQRASVILEYGSGGSTLLAADLPGKTIFSVESDPKWLSRLNTYLQTTPHPSRPVTYYADIGVTGDWGRPVGREGRANYPDYAAGIWHQTFFEQPDLVLIDGRFRPACFLVCAALTRAPLTILFDDYAPRPHYHYIEAVCRPVRRVDRMAVFEIVPGDFKAEHRVLLDTALYEPE